MPTHVQERVGKRQRDVDGVRPQIGGSPEFGDRFLRASAAHQQQPELIVDLRKVGMPRNDVLQQPDGSGEFSIASQQRGLTVRCRDRALFCVGQVDGRRPGGKGPAGNLPSPADPPRRPR